MSYSNLNFDDNTTFLVTGGAGFIGSNSTINVLDEHGINYVGAGQDNADARRPFVFELDGKKIGVYACCENEFSVATEDTPGLQ